MTWHIAGNCPVCKKWLTDEDEPVVLIHSECVNKLYGARPNEKKDV